MDKIDGPYYFFPLLKLLRDRLPAWLPLVGVDLGDTNVVPVDYVAKAMDHLAHLPDRDGEAFHLVNPEPQPWSTMINLFCAAGAPQFATPIDRGHPRRPARAGPAALRPRRSSRRGEVRARPGRARPDLGRLGVPAEVLAHTSFTAVFDSRATEKALAGSGIAVPDLESYARTLWGYWEDQPRHVDRPRPARSARGAHGQVRRDHRRLLRHRPGHRAQGRPGRRHPGPGGPRQGQARGDPGDDRDARRPGHVYPCDLSDLEAIDRLCEQLSAELPTVDFVVNNAGRSIRRSLRLSQDRFHDFERTMQLNYFGAIRLVMGLLPKMREQQRGHVVNVSSIGVQTNPPRFSAYVASKAALDAWSNVVASEVVGDGITFTSIHMPLVRTPMIAPTKLYDKFPTISARRRRPTWWSRRWSSGRTRSTRSSATSARRHTVAPKTAFRVLNMAYHVFPDSAAAKGGAEAWPAPRSPSRSCWPGSSRASTGAVVTGRPGAG